MMVYILIPNLNGLDHLKVCIDSLYRQTYRDFKIILVDNGSTDTSVKFTEINYPDVHVVRLDKNFGFARAVNEGLKIALSKDDCKFIMLLNNDTECSSNLIEEMLNGFRYDGVGSVGCKILLFDKRDIIDETGHFINKYGYPHKRGFGFKDTGQYDKPEYIFGACAASVIFDRKVFSDVGFLDEDFISYYEDVDFNFRLQHCGYKCYYVPSAICYHKLGATSGKFHGLKTYLQEKNLSVLIFKNFPATILLKYFILTNIVRFRSFVSLLLKGKFAELHYSLKGYFAGYAKLLSTLRKRSFIMKQSRATGTYIESFAKNENNSK